MSGKQLPDFSFNLLENSFIKISNFVIKAFSVDETKLRKNRISFLFVYKDFHIVLPLLLSCGKWDTPRNIIIEFFNNNDGTEKTLSTILLKTNIYPE